MTREVMTVTEDAPLSQVVGLMEARHVNRVPVMRGEVVGIVSRRDLLHALISRSGRAAPAVSGDEAIRRRIEAEIGKQSWAPGSVGVGVTDGIVELRGSISDERQRRALHVLVENVEGIAAIRDNLVWNDVNSGRAATAPSR
jgi:CBS domain-containing protein